MHDDVDKLVKAGRISHTVGEKLSTIAPEKYVLHNSWGAGKVQEWDLFAGKVTIDFEKVKDKTMGLKLALSKLTPLEFEDVRVQRLNSLDELKEIADNDPGEVIVRLLRAHGGKITPDQIDEELCGPLIEPSKYKKWWDRAKKSLRETKRANVPTKRTELISLRDENESPIEFLIKEFEEARNLKLKVKTLDAIKGELQALAANPSLLDRVTHQVNEIASKSMKLSGNLSFELLSIRDEFISAAKDYTLPEGSYTIQNALQDFKGNLAEEISSLASSRQRKIYEAFPDAFEEQWLEHLLTIFNTIGTRGVGEIAKILEEKEETEALHLHIKKAISLRILGPDALSWICREREKTAKPSFSKEVGLSVLNIIESDYLEDGPRKSNKLQALVMEDRELITDFIKGGDNNDIQNFSKKLLDSPAFPDLDRKSLMARIIKLYPKTGKLVGGTTTKKDNSLIVSWESLERKKEEYTDLVENRIPQNIKDISIARSYGDLRENFEYKAAKDMQAVLNRRCSEVEQELHHAKPTDFAGAKTDSINLGTVITLEDESKALVDLSILGAWDGDPDKNILSYKSEVASAMIGKKVGEKVSVLDFETEKMIPYTVKAIREFKEAATS